MMRRLALTFAVLTAVLLLPSEAQAYVGPGAGIAVATTGFMLVISLLLAIFGILFWPFRWLFKQLTRKRAPKPAKIGRAVLIGLDGLDRPDDIPEDPGIGDQLFRQLYRLLPGDSAGDGVGLPLVAGNTVNGLNTLRRHG